MDTNTNVVCYKSHNYPIWDVSFSPIVGYYFATASHDRTARIWATPYTSPLRILAGHLADVTSVRFHPNVNYVATGSSDKSLRLWEVHTGKCVRIFTGHHGSVNTLAFSPDGRLLASAGDDKSIILWDLATSKRLIRFTGHTGPIYSLDFSAEGALLASGSHDGTVRLWDPILARGVETEGLSQSDATNQNGSNESANTPPIGESNMDTSTSSSAPSLNNISDGLHAYHTRNTPVYRVAFTRRNLLLAAGPFTSAM